MSVNNEKLDMIYHKLSLKFMIPKKELKQIIESPYKFTYKTISDLKLKEDFKEEDFKDMKTNFIYRKLGRLYTTYNIITSIKHKYNKIKKEKENGNNGQ